MYFDPSDNLIGEPLSAWIGVALTWGLLYVAWWAVGTWMTRPAALRRADLAAEEEGHAGGLDDHDGADLLAGETEPERDPEGEHGLDEGSEPDWLSPDEFIQLHGLESFVTRREGAE